MGYCGDKTHHFRAIDLISRVVRCRQRRGKDLPCVKPFVMPLFSGMLNTDRLNRALTSLSSKGNSRFSFRNNEEEINRSPSNIDIASTLSSVAEIVAYSIRDEEKKVKLKSINCTAASSSSASKENTPTNIPRKGEGSGTDSRGHLSKKSLSTPLSQKRSDVNSSEKRRMSKHLQDRIFSSPTETPQRIAAKCVEEDELMAHRIAAKCLEEDELDAKLREINSSDIISALKQEIFDIRAELRNSKADAALSKKALSATKSKLDETLEELVKTKKDLMKTKSDRDEIHSLFQNHRCNHSSSDSLRQQMGATQQQLEQALDEIQKLSTRLRLAKNLSVSTKVQLDEALLEIERLKNDKYGGLNTTVSTYQGGEESENDMSCLRINTKLNMEVESASNSDKSNICHTPSKRSVVSSPLRPSSSRAKKIQQSNNVLGDKQNSDRLVLTSKAINDYEEKTQGHSSNDFEKNLYQFYKIHNPNKLYEVRKLLLKYEGRKQDLVEHLEKKYNSSFYCL